MTQQAVPASSARVRPVVDPPADVAALLAKGTKHDGEPLTMMKVLAHRPKVLRSMISIGGALWGSGHVGPRERELAILRSAWRTGCEYEFGHHRLLAPGCGVTDAEIAATAVLDLDGWTASDRLLLTAVDELCVTSRISPSTWSAMAGDWSEDQLLDLVLLVGTYTLIGMVVGGLDLPREPGVPGWLEADGADSA
ncbi:MAG TPA: carboxymuconolactone decarboxylase family protein [Acidimicrobiales bacterium]